MIDININESINNIPTTELKKAFKAADLLYSEDKDNLFNFKEFALSESEAKTDKEIDILKKRFNTYIIYDTAPEPIKSDLQTVPAPIQKQQQSDTKQFINISVHDQKHISLLGYGWTSKKTELDKKQLDDLVCGNNHSSIAWQDGKRNKSNFKSSQGVILDFDDGTTKEQILNHSFLKEFNLYLYSSKSHNKEKKDKPVCERWHLLLFLSESITDLYIFENTVKTVMELTADLQVDKACKDGARFFTASTKDNFESCLILDRRFLSLTDIEKTKSKEVLPLLVTETNTDTESSNQQQESNQTEIYNNYTLEQVTACLQEINKYKIDYVDYQKLLGFIKKESVKFPDLSAKAACILSKNPNYKDTEQDICDKIDTLSKDQVNVWKYANVFNLAKSLNPLFKQPLNMSSSNKDFDTIDFFVEYEVSTKTKTEKKIDIDILKLKEYLNKKGFLKEIVNRGEKGAINFYRKQNNFIQQQNFLEIIDFLDKKVELQYKHLFKIYTDFKKRYFNTINFFNVNKFDTSLLLRDTKDVIKIPYKNYLLEITKDGYKTKAYTTENVLKVQDKYNSINRELNINMLNIFDKEKYYNSIIYRFFKNVTTDINQNHNDKRFLNLKKILGYYLHKYKNDADAILIALTDFNTDYNSSNGGTGKSITTQFLNCYRNVTTIDGKGIDNRNDRFILEDVTKFDDIVCIEDVKKDMDMERLFNAITQDIKIEIRHKGFETIPFKIAPKMIITANRPLNIDNGASSTRRFIEFEYSNYYNLEHRPINDFKKNLITEFNNDDWFYADCFIIDCCMTYLKNGNIKRSDIDQVFIQSNRFMSEYEDSQNLIEYIKDNIQNTLKNDGYLKPDTTSVYFDLDLYHNYLTGAFKLDKKLKTKVGFSRFMEKFFKIILEQDIKIIKKRFGDRNNRTNEINCIKIS